MQIYKKKIRKRNEIEEKILKNVNATVASESFKKTSPYKLSTSTLKRCQKALK